MKIAAAIYRALVNIAEIRQKIAPAPLLFARNLLKDHFCLSIHVGSAGEKVSIKVELPDKGIENLAVASAPHKRRQQKVLVDLIKAALRQPQTC